MKRSNTLRAAAAAAAFAGLVVLAGCASDSEDSAWDSIDRTFDDIGATFNDAFGGEDEPDPPDRYHDPYDDAMYDD